MNLSDLKTWIDGQKPQIEAELKKFVEINTYTANTAGVDAGMDALSRLAEDLDFTVETINGRHRLISAKKGEGAPRVLLISHMDTVHPPDGEFLHYETMDEPGFVTGPGVGDIKGGMLMGLWAMQAVRELSESYDVAMVVSVDEENGSPSIRDWYLSGDHEADYAVGLEPGFPQGPLTPTVDLGVVYERRGYGMIRFKVKGLRCHSGTIHLGVNAMEAMAQRVIRIHALSDASRNVSATVGIVHGGTAPNTVAGEVDGTASWRFNTLADGEQLRDAIIGIIEDQYVYNEDLELGDSAEYTLEAFIPPMESNDTNMKMVDIVLEEAKRLGHNVVPIARGGGSDANFVAGSGTPSICGMGAPSQDIHTVHEKIYLPGLFDRIDLLTRTVYRLTKGEWAEK